MSYKVILKSGKVVAFGPNDENYEPTIKDGETLEIWEGAPTQEQINEGIEFTLL